MDNNTNNTEITEEVSLNDQMLVRREKLDALRAAGADPYEITKYDVTAHTEEIRNNFEELEGKEVSVAGRLMSRRDMGKANFIDLHDVQGKIQIYVKIDDIGEDAFAEFKKWDLGDIIGVQNPPR